MVTDRLRKRPLDGDAFQRHLGQSLQQGTAPGQLAKYGARIFQIPWRTWD